MLVIAETFTTVTYVGHTQQARHQTQIKSNHRYNLIHVCNIINAYQWNKPVEN